MSTFSGLIIRQDRLPSTDQLNAALANRGFDLQVDPATRLSPPATEMVGAILAGERAFFEYGADPLQPQIDAGEAPPDAAAYGDLVLSFETRGDASLIAAMYVQALLSERWGAAGWVEGELIPPSRHAADCIDAVRTLPEMHARLAEIQASHEYRQSVEAAHRVWLENQRPKSFNDWVKRLLRERGPDITGWALAAAVLAGLLVWSQIVGKPT